jgi:hypothetical protein
VIYLVRSNSDSSVQGPSQRGALSLSFFCDFGGDGGFCFGMFMARPGCVCGGFGGHVMADSDCAVKGWLYVARYLRIANRSTMSVSERDVASNNRDRVRFLAGGRRSRRPCHAHSQAFQVSSDQNQQSSSQSDYLDKTHKWQKDSPIQIQYAS